MNGRQLQGLRPHDECAMLQPMNGRQKARGGQRCAIIRDGLMLFLAEDLSGAKPVAEEDREVWALGVVLVHYFIGAGINKFRERGEAGVSKELAQTHGMDMFRPVARESEQGGESKCHRITHVPKGKERSVRKGKDVRKWKETEERLEKRGHSIAHPVDGGGVHRHGDQGT